MREYKLRGRASRGSDWRDDPITPKQVAFLNFLGLEIPDSKGEASSLIGKASEKPNFQRLRAQWIDQRQRLHPELYGHPKSGILLKIVGLLKLILLPFKILLRLVLLPLRLLLTRPRSQPHGEEMEGHRRSGSLLTGFFKLALLVVACGLMVVVWSAVKDSSSSVEPSIAPRNNHPTVKTPPAKPPGGVAKELSSSQETTTVEPSTPQSAPAARLSAQELYDQMGLAEKGFQMKTVSSDEWAISNKVQKRNYSITLRGLPYLKEVSATVLGESKTDTESVSQTFFVALCNIAASSSDSQKVSDWLNQTMNQADSFDTGGQSFQIYANSPTIRTLVVRWK